MRNFKFLWATLMLFLLMFFHGSVYAADFVVDGIAYDSCAVDGDNRALRVVVLPDESRYTGDIVIPQKVLYKGAEYHVATFDTRDMWDKENLTSVVINAEVTEIPSEFFGGCIALKQITLPKTLTTILERAFYGCTSLTSFSIPSKVTFVASDAFLDCSNITVLRFEDGEGTIDFRTSREEGWQIESLYIGRDMLGNGKYGYSYYTNSDWEREYGFLCIPSSLKSLEFGSLVTRIPNCAFENCTNLTNVVMGSNVTTIGSYAFYGCSLLESITLGSSVKEIGGSCFGNTGLKSIVIPDGVEVIGGTFSGCDSLSYVKLPDSLRIIGGSSFHNCTSLKSITLPERLESIEDCAFEGSGLTDSITIPKNVRYIGRLAFGSCKFSTVRMGAGVKVIADGAFENCTKIRRFYYDGTISDWCGIDFAPGCVRVEDVDYEDTPLYYVEEFRVNGDTTVVTDLVIPDSVKKIPMNAFASYRALKSVVIPATVDTVCSGAFYKSFYSKELRYLEKATVAAKEICPYAFKCVNELHLTTDVKHLDNNAINGIDSLYFSGTLEQFCNMHREGYGRKSYYDEEYNDSVYYIGGTSLGYVDNFFIQDRLVTDLSVPAMEKMDASIFQGFTGLKSVSLPSNVREIGKMAFYNCSGLQNVKFHQVSATASISQLTLDDDAFSYCRNLETVNLPASYIKKLGASAFSYCPKLTSVTCAEQFASSAKSTRAVSEEHAGLEIGEYCFQGDSLLYDMSFLDASNVESIGENAFDGTGWLKSLSDGLVYFGSCLYSYKGEAHANTILEIKEGTKTICSNALNGQAGIMAVTLPNSLQRINSCAFGGTGIESLTIPSSVEKISQRAFSMADSLSIIKFADGETPIKITDVSTSLIPCLYLNDIKSLYIGRTAEWYEKPDNFRDVVYLVGVQSLSNLTIGAKVSHFNHKFETESTKSLTDITVMNTTPPTSAYSFSDEAESGCTLHVPASVVETYKSTTPWSAFFNIVGESEETLGIEKTVMDDIDGLDAIHYNLSGISVSPKTKGMHIVKLKNGTSKKIFVK